VKVCPNCGEEHPERARFCLSCGTRLGEAAPTEERKVVTVLFCDLVGFTARSDKADPEDVKDALRPFHARIKREIELFGGTLDKFIGDAALGVFGSPVAHEDDPERAVRAALAIADAIQELNQLDPTLDLAVRTGVNTGEAVVAYGIGPQIGEAVTGDVVNTAARLQGVAPVGGIVVGEPTYRATNRVLRYQPLPPVTVKGKAEPLPIWRAVAARGRVGDALARDQGTPFVGRHPERRALVGAYRRAVREATAQLVVVAGEPGVGKSRLVAELGRQLDRSTDLVTWRQGRCLPYGEGVSFWALGEIVKAHAGILESDTAEDAAAKLDLVVPEDEPDRQWLRQRLAPLVGAGAPPAAGREESFAAWKRFLELVAATGPAVFVFEDVHWADQAMLAFLEHLAATSTGVPMLLVCSTRPELYDRHHAWAATGRNVTRIDLAPLSSQDTGELVSSMFGEAVPDAEVQRSILERAGGNPLFAEELVRMLKEQGLVVTRDRAVALADGAEVAFPESIQALIAARLDLVTPERKRVLQDGAVIGRVFWSGAVAAMGVRDHVQVTEALGELARKQLIRPAPVSSMEGQTEYVFWHALVRDVAYAQIPRLSRAERHLAAAAWIEEAAVDRVEDHAEVLAHHYTQAMRLAGAAGRPGEVERLRPPALRFLVMAGDRALGLNVGRAQAHYSEALELVPPEHGQRPAVLLKWAEAARQTGRIADAVRALEEAVDGFRAQGDRVAAGRAMGTLSSVLNAAGSQRHARVAAEAVRLLEEGGAGPEDLVAAYARMAGVALVVGDMRETIAWADRAAALGAGRGLEVPARALGFRGSARCALGDPAGLEELRAALALALDRGEGRDTAVLYNNLGDALLPVEGPASVLATYRQGIEFARRRGIGELAAAMAAGSLDRLIEVGEWDRALADAEAMADRAEAEGNVSELLLLRRAQVRVLVGRGQTGPARPLADWLVEAARESGGTEEVLGAFTAAAVGLLAAGEPDRALELLAEAAAWPHAAEASLYPACLPEMARTATDAGDPTLAQRLVAPLEPTFAYHQYALCAAAAVLAEARGRFAEAAARHGEAADRWGSFGVVPERAHALLGRGRCLVALGHPGAGEPLRQARQVFAGLRAQPLAAEADALLGRAGTRA
jgi:class 3 adenylate cyclase/tetratricopeptide (TPR) repeat protein